MKNDTMDALTGGAEMFDYAKLRQLRKERSYSLKQLAKIVGVSCSHLSELERGVKKPSPKTIEKLAVGLKIDRAQLTPEQTNRLTLGQRIRQLRANQGKTLGQLAQAANISLTYLNAIEHSEVYPSIQVLEQITEALGVSVVQLMGSVRDIGQKIRSLREQFGVTQAEVAERAEVSPGLVGQIEQGKIQPSLRTIERIAEALGTTPCFLITDSDHAEAVLMAMPPETRELLLDSKVQKTLQAIAVLNDREMNLVLKFIGLIKQNPLDEEG